MLFTKTCYQNWKNDILFNHFWYVLDASTIFPVRWPPSYPLFRGVTLQDVTIGDYITLKITKKLYHSLGFGNMSMFETNIHAIYRFCLNSQKIWPPKLDKWGVTSQGGLVGDQKLTENGEKLYHSPSFGNVSI